MAALDRAGRGANLVTGPGDVLGEGNNPETTRPLLSLQAERLARRFRMTLPHAALVAELALTVGPRR